MQQKYNEATINRPDGERLLNAPFVLSDLNAHIKQITQEDAWQKNDRNAITIFKSHHLSVVLIALHANAEMSTPDPSEGVATIQVIDGELDIEIEGKTSTVSKMQVISFHQHLQFHVTAKEQVIFLLTACNVS